MRHRISGANIRENVNAIRLGKATISMASFKHIAHNNITDAENILIQENTGDYVIGVENNESSYINLKQGKIDNNTLDGSTRNGYTDVTVNNITYYGELLDVAYTDFSKINNAKYELNRNDNLRLRLELTVK